MKLVKNYNKGMFALLELHKYAYSDISKDKYNMNLFKNCDLNKKITSAQRSILEFSVMNNNYNMVSILLNYNCNVIENESFIFSISNYIHSNSNNKKVSFEIFKLLLYKIKEKNINDTRNLIKNALQRILNRSKNYSKLIIYIMNFYPNILEETSISYYKSSVNISNLYLLEHSKICLKFNRKYFKYYNINVKNNIKTYLLIMNKLDYLPQELSEYILNFVELYKLKLKVNDKYLQYY